MPAKATIYMRFGKRVMDILGVTIALPVCVPFVFIIAVILLLCDTGPVFFLHERMGRNFSRFKLFKFRTMVAGAHTMGPSVTKGTDHRISKTGLFLRKKRLDELPQLFNVLKGEMSIVGPRPEVEKYVMLFKDDYNALLSIKPGITDPAILEYNNEQETLNKYADAEQGYLNEVLPAKIVLYKKYLDEISFTTDLIIILKTLKNLFFRKKHL